MFSIATILGYPPMGQSEPKPPQQHSDPVGGVYFACNIHVATIVYFIRCGFGHQALGVPAMLAFFMLFLTLGAEPKMMLWIALWLPALLIQRFMSWRNRMNGVVVHSRHEGYRWLAMQIPFVRKESTALLVEPFICLISGALLLPYSQFMGMFLMLGFLTILMRDGITKQLYNIRLNRMRDAQIEGDYLSGRLQGRYY